MDDKQLNKRINEMQSVITAPGKEHGTMRDNNKMRDPYSIFYYSFNF